MLLMVHDPIYKSAENKESLGKLNWSPNLQARSSFVSLEDAVKADKGAKYLRGDLTYNIVGYNPGAP